MKERGARGAVEDLVLTWLAAFRKKRSIALYMSDALGAFGRVSAVDLMAKLHCRISGDVFGRISAAELIAKLHDRGITGDLHDAIQSWSRTRSAQNVGKSPMPWPSKPWCSRPLGSAVAEHFLC